MSERGPLRTHSYKLRPRPTDSAITSDEDDAFEEPSSNPSSPIRNPEPLVVQTNPRLKNLRKNISKLFSDRGENQHKVETDTFLNLPVFSSSYARRLSFSATTTNQGEFNQPVPASSELALVSFQINSDKMNSDDHSPLGSYSVKHPNNSSSLGSFSIKTLRTDIGNFDGNPLELKRFLDGADDLYNVLDNPDQQIGFTQCIKRLLRGPAYNVIPNTEKDYPEVRRLLVANFGHRKTATTLRLELRQMSQERLETVDSYYHRMHMCLEDLKLAECHKYPAEVRDIIGQTIEKEVMQHFEAGLLPTIQNAITVGSHTSLVEASKAAKAREAVLLDRLAEQCRTCNSYNHVSNTCTVAAQYNPPVQQCPYCGKTGHFVIECPIYQKISTPLPEQLAPCEYCNKTDHYPAHCPEYQRPGNSNNNKCTFCSKTGHISRDCRIRIARNRPPNSHQNIQNHLNQQSYDNRQNPQNFRNNSARQPHRNPFANSNVNHQQTFQNQPHRNPFADSNANHQQTFQNRPNQNNSARVNVCTVEEEISKTREDLAELKAMFAQLGNDFNRTLVADPNASGNETQIL